MRTFSATYTDAVKFNRKPNEDYFLASEKYPIFSVADGVTRYVAEDLRYSYPAGARAAAQIFCQSILEYLEKNLRKARIRRKKQSAKHSTSQTTESAR